MVVEVRFVKCNLRKFSKSHILTTQQDFNNHNKLFRNCLMLWIKIHVIKGSIKMIF